LPARRRQAENAASGDDGVTQINAILARHLCRRCRLRCHRSSEQCGRYFYLRRHRSDRSECSCRRRARGSAPAPSSLKAMTPSLRLRQALVATHARLPATDAAIAWSDAAIGQNPRSRSFYRCAPCWHRRGPCFERGRHCPDRRAVLFASTYSGWRSSGTKSGSVSLA
jgi:hypothetical protein